MDEAVERFSPDGIVISTHPEGRSAWLRQDLVARATEKYDVPVEHIVARTSADVGTN
jgi:GABA permease